eukprot:TRINITY_DN16228_c0_g1_i9.p1 TRINITY_DN16228_c0_g1~~TRINITY_DN16228_c0_g1_i9.p1  ORF type:complete len:630 (+),score=174.50 TRINITY_DN16228_c0_g1_i9:140-2029(+)
MCIRDSINAEYGEIGHRFKWGCGWFEMPDVVHTMGKQLSWVKKQNKRNKTWMWIQDNKSPENDGLERWSQSDFTDDQFTLCSVRSVASTVCAQRSDSEAQTEPILCTQSDAQTDWSSSAEPARCIEVQTDTVEELIATAAAGEAQGAGPSLPEEELPVQVGEFLSRVLPRLEEAMNENCLSHAYNSLQVNWSDHSDFEAVVRHRLERPEAQSAACTDVTGVCLNSSANVLAVGFGNLKQQGWCDVQSSIAVWHMHQLQQGAEPTATRAPTAVLELPSSNFVTCLRFHPTQPAILVCGTYSGELIAWDVTAAGEALLFSSKISDYSHREPVSEVCWVWDAKEAAYQLASVGSDGRLLLWTMANKFDSPIIGFSLACVHKTNSIPRDAMVQAGSTQYRLVSVQGAQLPLPENKWRQCAGSTCTLASTQDSTQRECLLSHLTSNDNKEFVLDQNHFVVASPPRERILGGTAMAFYPKNRSVVIVGCESGAVMRCSFVTHDTETVIRQPSTPGAPLEWTHRAQALVDNVPAQHRQRLRMKIEDQAVTAKKDKITLQFILGSSCPEILQIFPSPVPFVFSPHQGPVMDISYSPFHRNLFLTCSTDGSARVYNTLQPRPILVLSLIHISEPTRPY